MVFHDDRGLKTAFLRENRKHKSARRIDDVVVYYIFFFDNVYQSLEFVRQYNIILYSQYLNTKNVIC